MKKEMKFFVVSLFLIMFIGMFFSSGVDALVEKPKGTMFVTSQKYYGNLGGIAGANQKCQLEADNAQLAGTWKALLSPENNHEGSLSSVLANLGFSGNLVFKNIDGQRISPNVESLITLDLERPINKLADGGFVPSSGECGVWTGLSRSGSTNACVWSGSSWSSQRSDHDGSIGICTTQNSHWYGDDNTRECDDVMYRLYCVRTDAFMVNPSFINLGNVPVGSSDSSSFEVTNSDSVSVQITDVSLGSRDYNPAQNNGEIISSISIQGVSNLNYDVGSNNYVLASPFSFSPGQTKSVTITCSPNSDHLALDRILNGKIYFRSGSSIVAEAEYECNPANPSEGVLTSNLGLLDFGEVAVGDSSSVSTTLTNEGGSNLLIDSVELNYRHYVHSLDNGEIISSISMGGVEGSLQENEKTFDFSPGVTISPGQSIPMVVNCSSLEGYSGISTGRIEFYQGNNPLTRLYLGYLSYSCEHPFVENEEPSRVETEFSVPMDMCAASEMRVGGLKADDSSADNYCVNVKGYDGYVEGTMETRVVQRGTNPENPSSILPDEIVYFRDKAEVGVACEPVPSSETPAYIISLTCYNETSSGGESCVDSDGGQSYFDGGAVVFEGENYEDSCLNGELVEYFCSSSGVDSISYSCAAGCNADGTACVAPFGGIGGEGFCSADEDRGLLLAPSQARQQTNSGNIMYCDFDGEWKDAKPLEASCVQSYECNSNSCLDGQCVSITGELEEQRNILNRIWCFLTNMREYISNGGSDNLSYQACLGSSGGNGEVD